jgi:hypothetical protein
MPIVEHLVATTRRLARTLADPKPAAWLFACLRKHFPEAWSCELMPDHLHMVTPPGERPRLTRVLASNPFGVAFDVLDPQPVLTLKIALRTVRYGFLNPVRDGLVTDAWTWRWSTMRDLIGAAFPIWTPANAIATALRQPIGRLVREVTTQGDHRPLVPRRAIVAAATFDGLRSAVAAALRMPESAVLDTSLGRRLIVQASAAISTPDAAHLAKELGCSTRTIHRDRAAPHSALDAVMMCLADERLRRSIVIVRR